MKKVLWAVLAVLLLVSCGKVVTSEPETPLELKVDNLEGKWVRESDGVWIEYKTDKTFNTSQYSGTFTIDNNTIKLSYTAGGRSQTAEIITELYKTYAFFNSEKHIKR